MDKRLRVSCCGFDLSRRACTVLEADSDQVVAQLQAEAPFPLTAPTAGNRGDTPRSVSRSTRVKIAGTERAAAHWGDAVRNGRLATRSVAPQPVVTRDAIPARDDRHPQRGKWAALVLETDRAQAQAALAPLLEHRAQRAHALAVPDQPPGLLEIRRPAGQRAETWVPVIQTALGSDTAWPRYLLLVGGPERIPFEVQFMLDGMGLYTGRLDVSQQAGGELCWDACARYAQRVVAHETARAATPREVLFFSTAADEHTQQAHQQLAQPLLEHLRRTQETVATRCLFGRDATLANLQAALHAEASPPIVVTISHGIEQPPDPTLWGALSDSQLVQDELGILSAQSVSAEQRFADGAIWFSFACHSAGVVQRSAHRLFQRLEPLQKVAADRVAALPRMLLGLPRGPLAFVGHVDGLTSCAYASEALPSGASPYCDFLDWLTQNPEGCGTLGRALSSLRECRDRAASRLVQRYLAAHRGKQEPPAAEALWREWLRYLDYQGFMLLGDPAITLSHPPEPRSHEPKAEPSPSA